MVNTVNKAKKIITKINRELNLEKEELTKIYNIIHAVLLEERLKEIDRILRDE